MLFRASILRGGASGRGAGSSLAVSLPRGVVLPHGMLHLAQVQFLFWIPAIPCLHSYCKSLGSLAPRPCHPPISEGLDVGPALGRGPGLGGHCRGRRVRPSFGRRALPCLGWLLPLVSGALHLGLASWPGPLGLLCGVALRGCCGHWTLGPISRSSATSVKVTAVGHFFQARCAMDSRALRSRTSVEPIATQSESETCLCM